VFQEHYPPLVIAYLIGVGGWLAVSRIAPQLWPHEPAERFAHPWREFGIALVGATGILAVGQLWSRGIRLPEQGAFGPVFGAINQILIFAPILLVVVIRRQSWATAWLPRRRISLRLLVGLMLASLAVTAYSLLRAEADAPWVLLGRIWRYEQVSQGATWSELVLLLRDAGLGVAVVVVLQRSRDVAWFWCLHFCLDMTQFARVTGVG
jgi:hypothetical protein